MLLGGALEEQTVGGAREGAIGDGVEAGLDAGTGERDEIEIRTRGLYSDGPHNMIVGSKGGGGIGPDAEAAVSRRALAVSVKVLRGVAKV